MDGGMTERIQHLMQILKARTDKDGKAKPGYRENVAAIRAELAMHQEAMNQGGNVNG
jgi:hypothetical protein